MLSLTKTLGKVDRAILLKDLLAVLNTDFSTLS